MYEVSKNFYKREDLKYKYIHTRVQSWYENIDNKKTKKFNIDPTLITNLIKKQKQRENDFLKVIDYSGSMEDFKTHFVLLNTEKDKILQNFYDSFEKSLNLKIIQISKMPKEKGAMKKKQKAREDYIDNLKNLRENLLLSSIELNKLLGSEAFDIISGPNASSGMKKSIDQLNKIINFSKKNKVNLKPNKNFAKNLKDYSDSLREELTTNLGNLSGDLQESVSFDTLSALINESNNKGNLKLTYQGRSLSDTNKRQVKTDLQIQTSSNQTFNFSVKAKKSLDSFYFKTHLLLTSLEALGSQLSYAKVSQGNIEFLKWYIMNFLRFSILTSKKDIVANSILNEYKADYLFEELFKIMFIRAVGENFEENNSLSNIDFLIYRKLIFPKSEIFEYFLSAFNKELPNSRRNFEIGLSKPTTKDNLQSFDKEKRLLYFQYGSGSIDDQPIYDLLLSAYDMLSNAELDIKVNFEELAKRNPLWNPKKGG